MPKMSLRLHPDSRSTLERVEVEAVRDTTGLLHLTYSVSGAIDRVAIPGAQPSLRTDELWKHTCFELFLSAAKGYYELNFSPSSQWAAYRFDAHRAGMRDAILAEPTIEWRATDGQGVLTVTVQLPHDATGPLGVSTVIENIDGDRSFWALAHPPGRPDFHNAACFVGELPPAG